MKIAAATAALTVGLAGCGSSVESGTSPTGPATFAPQCQAGGRPALVRQVANCHSPDGAWTFSGLGTRGGLYLTRRGSTKPVRVYRSSDACCSYITWAKPHLLLFVDDYRVMLLNPATRRLSLIAGFSNFLISPDRQWLAGFAAGPPEEAETVGVLSLRNHTCVVIPRGSHQTDEIAGFTRDSKSVIVNRTGFDPNNGPVGRPRLVAFALSSLRTPCPHSMLTP